jgi:hypothetical protein
MRSRIFGGPLREYDDDAMYDAEMEAAAELHYEELGKGWVRDHAEDLAKEFFEENYKDAINQFTGERLQSYYLKHPELASAAFNALQYAQSLRPSYHRAALVFAVTSTELTVKNVLLRPIISGLVHTEELASVVADLTTKHTGIGRFQDLLTEILGQYGGFELKTFRRPDSGKTLWQEMDDVQKARNNVIHRGAVVDEGVVDLSISVASVLLGGIFRRILKKIGLHLHSPIMICGCTDRRPTE